MTPTRIRASVVSERAAWVRSMLLAIQDLPMDSYAQFVSDPRNVAAAESFLRRSIEALLDLGRHILAKGFAYAVTEYKEIGDGLAEMDIIPADRVPTLRKIAGYRNRMVHFYHENTQEEFYNICTGNISEIEEILTIIITWVRGHPDKVDHEI
ncbi:MAG: type VII toxin-antitoxin system HepT family RNase toxin [Thermodesulfobacteriota bacterium]